MAVAVACRAQDATAEKVAFLKGDDVYIASAGGNAVKRLTTDGVHKSLLRLSPDGRNLAYRLRLEPGEAIGHVMVISSDGEVVRDILFRPPGPVLIGGMRFIEELWWSDAGHLVLYGSVNPNNCEYVAVNVATGTTTADYGMACGTQVASPDHAHVAYAGPPGIGVQPEDFRQCLDVDGRRVYTRQDNGQLLTDAVWSGDSASLAFLEEDMVTRIKHVVVANLKGKISRLPVPSYFEAPMALRWVGNNLLLETPRDRCSVYPDTQAFQPVTIEIEEKLQALTEAKRTREVARQRALALARKLGAQNDDIDVFLP
jgi:hypothetical protein